MIKHRNIGLAIVFSLITCGIYGLYWLASMNNDINTISRENKTSGGMVVLLSFITCGIYSWYWLFKAGDTLDRVRSANGEAPSNQGILYIILAIFGLGVVSYALIQNEINRYAEQ